MNDLTVYHAFLDRKKIVDPMTGMPNVVDLLSRHVEAAE